MFIELPGEKDDCVSRVFGDVGAEPPLTVYI